MSELGVFSTFKNSELGCSLTVIKNSDEIWFVGNEIATTLRYTNPQKAIRDHVDESDKIYFQDFNIGETLGLNLRVNDSFSRLNERPQTIIISEAGAYCLILRSRLPAAKKFTKWVTKEVLPTIRKTGTYTMPEGAIPKLQTITNNDIVELEGVRRKIFRYESLNKSNQTKNTKCVESGQRGGTKTQERWRKIKTEHKEYKKDNMVLKLKNKSLQAELDEITVGLEELAQD